MNFEKNKDIVQQFEKLCEREWMNAADVLLWFMGSVVGSAAGYCRGSGRLVTLS